jgi:hypothetical protein
MMWRVRADVKNPEDAEITEVRVLQEKQSEQRPNGVLATKDTKSTKKIG